jgi:hypothetical protein
MSAACLKTSKRAAVPALINAVLEKTQYRDINGCCGLAERWAWSASTIMAWQRDQSADQRRSTESSTGQYQVQEFARHLGLPVDAALKTMAQYLPQLVDQASPNGVLQSHTR